MRYKTKNKIRYLVLIKNQGGFDFELAAIQTRIIQLLKKCIDSKIGVLSSSKSSDLGLFSDWLSTSMLITAPNQNERVQVLEQLLLKRHQPHSINVSSIACSTLGYYTSDLKNLMDRACCLAMMRGSGDELIVSHQDVLDALNEYTPCAMQGVKFFKMETEWADVGGLRDAKKMVLETLAWPSKYAPIFAQCPLRLRSGILLYGYSGCGKTMLASAIAQECGLNFVSIKGILIVLFQALNF